MLIKKKSFFALGFDVSRSKKLKAKHLLGSSISE